MNCTECNQLIKSNETFVTILVKGGKRKGYILKPYKQYFHSACNPWSSDNYLAVTNKRRKKKNDERN